jgi:catechol 2,3-dioxygenase-like lactoylglutathione lyase family enzyme
MKPEGIHHVALRVSDADAATAFYCDILGMAVVARPDAAPVAGAWLDAGGEQLHLIEGTDPISTPHFAIQISDLSATVAAIREKGVTVYETDHLRGAGYQAFVVDPSGNLVELNQPEESV